MQLVGLANSLELQLLDAGAESFAKGVECPKLPSVALLDVLNGSERGGLHLGRYDRCVGVVIRAISRRCKGAVKLVHAMKQ